VRATGEPWAASLVNVTVGLGALGLVALVTLATTPLDAMPGNPLLYVGGLLGAFVVVVTATAVQTLGVLRLGLAMVAGQTTGALIVDLVAPAPGERVTAATVVGVVLTLVAVSVSERGQRTSDAADAGEDAPDRRRLHRRGHRRRGRRGAAPCTLARSRPLEARGRGSGPIEPALPRRARTRVRAGGRVVSEEACLLRLLPNSRRRRRTDCRAAVREPRAILAQPALGHTRSALDRTPLAIWDIRAAGIEALVARHKIGPLGAQPVEEHITHRPAKEQRLAADRDRSRLRRQLDDPLDLPRARR
jgi:uncharacterized membrane protein YdcZ (DUF606 family)